MSRGPGGSSQGRHPRSRGRGPGRSVTDDEYRAGNHGYESVEERRERTHGWQIGASPADGPRPDWARPRRLRPQ